MSTVQMSTVKIPMPTVKMSTVKIPTVQQFIQQFRFQHPLLTPLGLKTGDREESSASTNKPYWPARFQGTGAPQPPKELRRPSGLGAPQPPKELKRPKGMGEPQDPKEPRSPRTKLWQRSEE
eukprot:gene2167-18111_t